VFISQSSHDQIVALYKARLEEQERQYEARLAFLIGEVVFYRQAWLDRLGVKFPIPKPAEVTAVSPSAPVTVPSELEERKTFKLDRAEWTMDDVQFYEDYHARPMLQKGTPREELEYWYYQAYGNQLPMKVFLDLSFPVS
jgi:hypothetical protein